MMRHLFCTFCILCVFSCGITTSQTRKNPPERSFYYWRTTYEVSEDELKLADSMGVKHMYLRYFDLDWEVLNNRVTQVSRVRTRYGKQKCLSAFKITPVVYLTNKVFEKLDGTEIDSLAKLSFLSIEEVSKDLAESYAWAEMSGEMTRDFEEKKWQSRLTEIQFDCDWTEGTKDKYFKFLSLMKEKYPKLTISTTVRLWQYKYRQKAGIPPADRGMLMCYNVANPKDYSVSNSIADHEEIGKYFTGNNEAYPLPLDVALPLFSWGVLFRYGKYVGLMGNLDNDYFIEDCGDILAKENEGYRFTRDTVVGRMYIREGDLLKIHRASQEDLSNIVDQVRQEFGDSLYQVAFFDWNMDEIKYYGQNHIINYFKKLGL